ncbi:hypothetical protein ANCCEY_13796 [Ancylostoma ceylanicum]|uniref:Uncharacterized protein n=1 Tax=Ancylostoma ceylanicum TaxID=53326 RepID=A0A0D6LHI0_9BILA|nr:hypothetical protein ANCCEY_13796 [Ancylostoma ceylanicum]
MINHQTVKVSKDVLMLSNGFTEVVYVVVVLPFIIMVALLAQLLTLEGSSIALWHFLRPDWYVLKNLTLIQFRKVKDGDVSRKWWILKCLEEDIEEDVTNKDQSSGLRKCSVVLASNSELENA